MGPRHTCNNAAIEVELPGGSVVRVCDPQVIRDVIAVVLEHGGGSDQYEARKRAKTVSGTFE
ncbi:MAG: hypothetical protein R3C19_12600 [Planctomycetaceae bacterium]